MLFNQIQQAPHFQMGVGLPGAPPPWTEQAAAPQNASSPAGGGGLMASIQKLFGGQDGQGLAALMHLFGG